MTYDYGSFIYDHDPAAKMVKIKDRPTQRTLATIPVGDISKLATDLRKAEKGDKEPEPA